MLKKENSIHIIIKFNDNCSIYEEKACLYHKIENNNHNYYFKRFPVTKKVSKKTFDTLLTMQTWKAKIIDGLYYYILDSKMNYYDFFEKFYFNQ